MPQFSLAASQELASEPYILAVEYLPRRSYLSDLSGHEQPPSIKIPLKWQIASDVERHGKCSRCQNLKGYDELLSFICLLPSALNHVATYLTVPAGNGAAVVGKAS